MLIPIGVSAETPYSPRRQGTVTRRPMNGTTGRERIALDDRRLDLLLGVVAAADRVAQGLVGVGVAHQPLPGPRERVRGRLVAGEDQGEQLVADFFVVHRLALLGARLQEQGEDVAALRQVLVGAAGARSPRRSGGRAA